MLQMKFIFFTKILFKIMKNPKKYDGESVKLYAST